MRVQGFAPVDIILNGHVLLQHHEMADWGVKEGSWDLPVRMLHPGDEANK